MAEIKVQSSKKYDSNKWRKIINTTQSNYANMIKRLSRKQKILNLVLIYYSIFLIVNTLTGKYFPQYFNTELSEYFGIILSVVMLAYSLINNSSNYAVRISDIEESLNRLKTIKRSLSEENLDECISEYNKVADSTERREDVDFFITVKHLCKEFKINWFTKKRKKGEEGWQQDEDAEEYRNQEKVVNDYISEINVLIEEGKIVFEFIWEAILFLIPILVFILCIISSTSGLKINIK